MFRTNFFGNKSLSLTRGPGSNPTWAENFISHFSVVCLTRPGLGERLTIRLSQIISVNVSEHKKKQLPNSNIVTA